jgi:hypothetical protein
MKIPLVLLALVCALMGHASPFLEADAVPQASDPNLNPVSYVITGLATSAITTAAVQNADGTLQLKYDLGSLANGTYTVSAAAVNIFGGESVQSAPFSFSKGSPGTPTGLRISPN